MVHDNSSAFGTAFTVSIEARRGVSTGISAHDRATTIRTAIAETAEPEDLVRPVTSSHHRPERRGSGAHGQTEGSVDLARLAGAPQPGDLRDHDEDGTDGADARPRTVFREHNLGSSPSRI